MACQRSPWTLLAQLDSLLATFQKGYFSKGYNQEGFTSKRLQPKKAIIWHGLIHAPKGSMDLFWRGTFQRSYFLQAKSKKASPLKGYITKGYYYQKASSFQQKNAKSRTVSDLASLFLGVNLRLIWDISVMLSHAGGIPCVHSKEATSFRLNPRRFHPKKATSQKGYYYQKASKFLEIDQYIRGI